LIGCVCSTIRGIDITDKNTKKVKDLMDKGLPKAQIA
jgi:hypothetical protein